MTGADFEISVYAFGNQKKIVSLMYNISLLFAYESGSFQFRVISFNLSLSKLSRN